jgi:hypothetical protein
MNPRSFARRVQSSTDQSNEHAVGQRKIRRHLQRKSMMPLLQLGKRHPQIRRLPKLNNFGSRFRQHSAQKSGASVRFPPAARGIPENT